MKLNLLFLKDRILLIEHEYETWIFPNSISTMNSQTHNVLGLYSICFNHVTGESEVFITKMPFLDP